jgi:hypothetical protein
VNRRAMRKRRLQNRAWSLVAALLPATAGWATDGSDGAATKADPTSTAAAASFSEPGNAVPNPGRLKIPPPRPFNPAAMGTQPPVASQSKSKIPPPRRYDTMPTPAQLAVEQPAGEAPVPPATRFPATSPDQNFVAAPPSAPIPDLVVPFPSAETPTDQAQPAAAGFPEVSIPSPERPDTNINADEAPSQLTAPADLPAVDPAALSRTDEPAPMPEPVNQALRALAANPAIGPVAAPSPMPVSDPEPKPSSGPEPVRETSQTQAKPVADSNPETGSIPSAAAIQAPALNVDARVPESKGAIPPQAEDDQVEQVECSTCGGYHGSSGGGAFHARMGCADGMCIPGRQPCAPDKECNTIIGAFLNNMYQELCCPDPCYQPKWEPAAFASFFADYARPRTVTRIRYDNLENMEKPDRNQFWIKSSSMMNFKNHLIIPKMRLQQVYLYQEIAAGNGSFFVEIPYRQINPNFMPSQSGFSDINFGIKSMFYDHELLQLSTQFRTYTPSGNFQNNLGTGNFALDPSIMGSLKLGSDTYFQAQFGNWIPLGGSKLSGGIFYGLMSVNQVLWYPRQDSPLIATLEMDFWAFENGGYTNAINTGRDHTGAAQVFEKGGVAYFNIGPGLRQSICNKLDVGGAITFATASPHWAQPWFRFEVRFLF